MKPWIIPLVALSLLSGAGRPASAGTLVINTNASDPAPRAAWETAVDRFQKEHPNIEVKFNLYDHESYKKAIRNWLTSAPPDVVFWFVGHRMREFAAPGLLEDVSELFTPSVRAELHRAAVDLVSLAGKQYGVPYSFYQVGFYFRKDLFDKVGITQPPRDWGELIAVCDRLARAGIEPIALGSKDLWPTAAWFDYLNLRLNGYGFHMELMGGKIPYTDARVRAVFDKWGELIGKGCFARNHASLSWQESQSLLYQGKAAMMLIGNYIVPNFPPEVRERLDFAPFPTISPGVALAEDAPMNSIHIPARARNKEDAKKFLAYILRADVQEALNKTLLQIPVNTKAAVADDRFLKAGEKLLSGARNLAQFFDRDTSEDLATVAMKGFQEFMLNPDRLESVLNTIERARNRIYKN